MAYTLDGTNSTSGAGSSVVQVAISVLDSGALRYQMSNTAYTSSVAGTFVAPTIFTFTYGQPNSTLTVFYDGVSKLTQSTFPGALNTSISAGVGPQAFGVAFGGTWSFDNFEVLTTRSP